MTTTRKKQIRHEPAASILEKLGGPAHVADEVLGVAPSVVYRLMYSKEEGGRGGRIPFDYHEQILAYSAKHRKGVKPADLVAKPSVYHEDLHLLEERVELQQAS